MNEKTATFPGLASLREWAPAIVVVASCAAAYFNLQAEVVNDTAAIAEMRADSMPSRIQTLEDGFRATQAQQAAQASSVQAEIASLQASEHDTADAVTAQAQSLATIQAQLGFLIRGAGKDAGGSQ